MDKEPQPLKFGDPCPVNGLPFVPAIVPTADQYARLTDKENPAVLGRFHDTASESDRARLGALYIEPNSGYKTRFPLEEVEAASETTTAGASGDRKAGRGKKAD